MADRRGLSVGSHADGQGPQREPADRQGRGAVDGDDNVWVSNFGGQRLSKFCGTSHKGCRTGQALSPSTGYAFDGLVRNTGVAVDPSGNVWLANNWKTYPFPQKNPGGYEMVAFIGLAGPIRTPLIGPPRPL